MRSLAITSLFLLFLLPLTGAAQIVDTTNPDLPLRITVTPEVPGPNTPVSISVDAANIGNAVVSWDLDGERTRSGYGIKRFDFTTAGAGETTTVLLSVSYPGQAIITRSFRFNPSDVTLIVESNTYVPPFYQGRGPYTPGAAIRVVALADIRDASGNLIPDTSLSFAWRLNDDNVPEASGVGKNTYILLGNQIKSSEVIGVTVSNRTGTPLASRDITVMANEPRIVFYARDGFGRIDYTRALSEGHSFGEREATLVAEPYFFSGRRRDDSHLSFTWRINGVATESQGAQGFLTVRTETEGEGLFDLEIQNTRPYQILQGAQSSLRASFGATESPSFFGL